MKQIDVEGGEKLEVITLDYIYLFLKKHQQNMLNKVWF